MNAKLNKQCEEVITACLKYTEDSLISAKLARDKTEKGSKQNVMLCGKIKAYTDIACLIRNRWLNHNNRRD